MKIDHYDDDASISLSDRVIGSDAENSRKTKQFSLGGILNFFKTQGLGVSSQLVDSRPYKVYTARFVYTNLESPLVVTVLENTISSDIIINRFDKNYYELTSASFTFPTDKTDINISTSNNPLFRPTAVLYSPNEINISGCFLTQFDDSFGLLANYVLTYHRIYSLEIRVYN